MEWQQKKWPRELPPINNHLLEAETKQSNYVKSMFIYLAM
jgi:hypothetical protein